MKILYFDVETTGKDCISNHITQIAGIIEIDGQIKEEFNLDVKPLDFTTISPEALAITGKTVEMLESYPSYKESYTRLLEIFDRHIDRYDSEDKFYPAGYNVSFDMDFLRQFFYQNDDKYFGSYFHYRPVDPLPIFYFLEGSGKINLKNYKLSTVCEHFGIGINAHDALSDIKATRELCALLKEKYL